MMSLDKNISHIGDSCTGCGACANICHNNSIIMEADEEGFKRPKVLETCVECGLCLNVCPANYIARNREFQPIGYVAITKSSKIYKTTASGGIFTTLADYFLNEYKNGVVVGAAWSDEKVQHIVVDSCTQLYRLSNSKYVQSETGFIYKKVNLYLKEGRRVLFSGTPCQIAAVKRFTKNHPLLTTIDIICHGVPSPHFLNHTINSIASGKIIDIGFRWKNVLSKYGGFFLVIKTKRTKHIFSNAAVPYFNMFMKNMTYRLSCYECNYANLQREGDITLGDCDSSALYSSFHPGYSKSAVLVNSTRGKDLWDNCSNRFDFVPLDIEKEAEVNTPLKSPEKKPAERNYIYSEIESLAYTELVQKYGRKDHFIKNVMLRILDKMPYNIK